jgi:putative ATP-dependent endonuclease of OLD family
MLLRSVRIENFRAVKSAAISFDLTTVLIGENDCGRSSVMEAIALVLGWNAEDGGFQFQPFHVHRPAEAEPSAVPPILIALEFSESVAGEWDSGGFEPLRGALPDALGGDRRFWLEVTRTAGTTTRWTFVSAGRKALVNDGNLLAWLRRRMPVFWMAEGMVTGRSGGVAPAQLADGAAGRLADQVSKQYRDLLEGTALDVSAAIEGGSAAANQLLLARANPLNNQTILRGEVLDEITGRRKSPSSGISAGQLRRPGTAAQKIGVLLLAGALLRSGANRKEGGEDPLALIEDPEAHLHPMTLASIWSVMDQVGGQKIIATHSGGLLASARLSSIRRLTRREGVVKEWRVPDGSLKADELRRYTYHLRSRRASASFARCWLLVEGETEFWLMGELARVCGYEFASEGVVCVEFAQCGLAPLIKVAQHLGIEWHLLADGDTAGRNYAQSARQYANPGSMKDRMTLLQEVDIENCFWRHGYADVFRNAAYSRNSRVDPGAQRRAPAKAVIKRALERHSKPLLAVKILDSLIDRGPEGVPLPLRNAIETCIRLARG